MNLRQKVIKEATALREQATAMELSRLDFNSMNPAFANSCIYGQMTGDCTSDRAIYLMRKCTKPVEPGARFIPNVHFMLRGSSPIETYILNPDPRSAALISYLRGERETLTEADL